MSGVCALLPHKRRTVTRRTLINGNNHNDISAKANGLKTPIRVSIRYIFSQNEKDSNTGSTLAYWSAGSRLSRQTAAHRRRLWATGTPIPVRQVPIWPLAHAITRSARRIGISVRLFGDGAGDVPKTGTSPAKMGQNEGNVPETGTSPAVRPFSLPETGTFHLQN